MGHVRVAGKLTEVEDPHPEQQGLKLRGRPGVQPACREVEDPHPEQQGLKREIVWLKNQRVYR